MLVSDILHGCHFCNSFPEDSGHLFFTCKFSHSIWMQMYNWFGLVTLIHNDIKDTSSNILDYLEGEFQINIRGWFGSQLCDPCELFKWSYSY